MVTCAIALLAALVTTGQVESSRPEPPELSTETFTLENGLRVLLQRDSTVPRVTVCVTYHVGSHNEMSGQTGFAHFFEHLMFRGSMHVPNYDTPLQEAGAEANAFTTEDVTTFFENVPTPYLERALYLEAERMAFLGPAISQKKFELEREVVKSERQQMFEDVPYGLALEALAAMIYPSGHPYSWAVIGSTNDLDRATVDDLKQFHARFYHPANAVLCLVGDFEPAGTRDLIARYYGTLSSRPMAVWKPARVTLTPARRVMVDRVATPRIYFAWPTVQEGHPDAAALDLLAVAIGQGHGSWLSTALKRDQQIAQEVYAESDTREIGGSFWLQATAVPGTTVEEARAWDRRCSARILFVARFECGFLAGTEPRR